MIPELADEEAIEAYYHQFHNDWICDMCFPDIVEIGSLAPTIYLGMKGKLDAPDVQFFLVAGQGHQGDIIWSSTPGLVPFVDPWTGKTDEEIDQDDAGMPLWEMWAEQSENEMFFKEIDVTANVAHVKTSKLGFTDLRATWLFVEELKAGGYDPIEDGATEFWLYDQMGKLITEYEDKHAEVAGNNQQAV